MTAARTLWVTNDLPPRSGGIEQFVGNLLARGRPAGIRVLASDWPTAAAFDGSVGYEVRRIGRRPLLPTPALLARVRAEIADHDADVVVFGAAWPLGELAAALERPCLALTHGHEAGLARVGLGRLVRRVARGVDVLGVISDFTAQQLAPWVEGHTQVRWLPPGVDTGRFSPAVDGRPVRAAFGLDDGRPLVLCLARLVARKGQDVLVAAWPRVRASVPGAHLLLAGDGPLAAMLRHQVQRLGLEGAVTFAGDVRAAALPGYHAAADVFAMPSRTRLGGLDVEGLGIVYLEAQACGKPVVAGCSGGAPEAVVDGQTAVVVDGRDVAAVAAAVVGLLANRGRAAAMGAAGRAFVEGRYAWDRVAAVFWDTVEELARRGHAGAGDVGWQGGGDPGDTAPAGPLAFEEGRVMDPLTDRVTALVARRAGDDVAVGVETLTPADLGEGDVTVAVAYSGVNYKDGLAIRPDGKVAEIDPLVPGVDLAGTVAASDDRRYPPGAPVIVHGYDLGVAHHGGFATAARVPAGWVVPLPDGLSVRDAMTLGTAGFTAGLSVHLLEQRGLAPGDGPVLVTGASGGVGSLAVQILARRGYEVVASSGKADAHDWLRGLGAREVVGRDAVTTDRPLGRQRWAGAVDCVGGDTLAGILASLRRGAAVAASGNTGGAALRTTVFPFILRGVALLGVDSAACPHDVRVRIWQRLAGDLRPAGLEDTVAAEVGLGDDLVEALRTVVRGGMRGRTIVRVGG